MFVMTALVCRLATEYETPLTSDPPEMKFTVLSIGGGGNGASPCPSFICANVAFPFSVSKSLRNHLFSSFRTFSLNVTHSVVVWSQSRWNSHHLLVSFFLKPSFARGGHLTSFPIFLRTETNSPGEIEKLQSGSFGLSAGTLSWVLYGRGLRSKSFRRG